MNAPARNVFAGALLLLALAVVVWFALQPSAATAPPTATATMHWREGNSQRYRLVVGSTVRLSGVGAASAEPMEQQVRGELVFRTLAVTPAGVTVGLRLSPVELRVGGVVGEPAGRALTVPFRVRFAPDGMPMEFAFPDEVDAPHAALLEELVRTFQLAVGDEAAWVARETHATGTYEARYERTATGDLRRTKLRYLADAASEASSPDLQVLAATASVALDPGADWIGSMDVDERLVRRDPSGVAIDVATTASLVLLPTAPAAAMATVDDWSFGSAATATGGAAVPLDRLQTGRTSHDLQAELDDVVADLDAMTEGRTVAIHRLRDLLRADARAADLLLAILRERELTDRTRADLYLAFELGGTTDAQASLCRIAGDAAWSPRDRTRALIALGGVACPDDATLSALWRATQDRSSAGAADRANTAILALGSLGRTMIEANRGDPATVRDGLLSAAWGAADPGERATLVTAIGNVGDRAVVPEVTPFLDDRAPEVRRAAAKTLGRLDGDAVATELAQRLGGERSSRVRAGLAAALLACATPAPAAMAAVREAVAGEPDEATRLDLARLLGRHLTTEPANRGVLQALLATETSNKVRQCIEDALRTVVTPPGG